MTFFQKKYDIKKEESLDLDDQNCIDVHIFGDDYYSYHVHAYTTHRHWGDSRLAAS